MNRNVIRLITRGCLILAAILLTGVATSCAHRLYARMQPDGWSAQPIVNACRFTQDADLDSATGTPVGDEGYYLYILTEAAKWDFSDAKSILISIWMHPYGHSWIILESPDDRMEFGQTGNIGKKKPRYHEGAMKRLDDVHPNPIAYLWETMPDGKLQIGKPDRPPTFVWRMPITRLKYQLIYEHVMNRKYDEFDLRTNNCTDMAAEVAALASVNLIHRIRLTLPPETEVWFLRQRIWKDTKYRILEFSTPEVLEVDLRQLAQFGIGSDYTEWYLTLTR